jgi:uncharacterized protein YoaH (UPF0181 family)
MLKGNSKAVVGENQRTLMAKGMSEKRAIMVSMKRSKAVKSKESKVMAAPSSPEDYPYGLRVELDHDGMNKLGMKKMPKVGSKVKFHAHATVKSASESTHEGDSKPNRSASLQITHMKVHG